MILNGVKAFILLYFTEFDSFAGVLRHSGWRWSYIVCRIASSTFGQNWANCILLSALLLVDVDYFTSKSVICRELDAAVNWCHRRRTISARSHWRLEKLRMACVFEHPLGRGGDRGNVLYHLRLIGKRVVLGGVAVSVYNRKSTQCDCSSFQPIS